MSKETKQKGIKKIQHLYKRITTEDYVKDYVDVEKFFEACKACPNFGARWSCPPFDYDVMDCYWRKYKYLHLFVFKMYLDDDFADEDMTEEQLNELVMNVRRQNSISVSKWIMDIEKRNPDSVALDGGNCYSCKKCRRVEGKPCRYGDKYRPFIDAIGGNLVKTAEEIFATKILWIENGAVPEYMMFMVGLLSNNEYIRFKF